jgi:hypothetical protein
MRPLQNVPAALHTSHTSMWRVTTPEMLVALRVVAMPMVPAGHVLLMVPLLAASEMHGYSSEHETSAGSGPAQSAPLATIDEEDPAPPPAVEMPRYAGRSAASCASLRLPEEHGAAELVALCAVQASTVHATEKHRTVVLRSEDANESRICSKNWHNVATALHLRPFRLDNSFRVRGFDRQLFWRQRCNSQRISQPRAAVSTTRRCSAGSHSHTYAVQTLFVETHSWLRTCEVCSGCSTTSGRLSVARSGTASYLLIGSVLRWLFY